MCIRTADEFGIGRRIDSSGTATASDALGKAFSGPGHTSRRGVITGEDRRQKKEPEVQHVVHHRKSRRQIRSDEGVGMDLAVTMSHTS